jgi:hypothetical protein
MMNEARLVLPIPPGTHWKDAKPIVLPGAQAPEDAKALPAPRVRTPKPKVPVIDRDAILSGGLRFGVTKESAIQPKPKRSPRPKAKNDPRLVAAARELRDRWMEEINSGRYLPESNGKYAISRAIEHSPATIAPMGQLPAPIAA